MIFISRMSRALGCVVLSFVLCGWAVSQDFKPVAPTHPVTPDQVKQMMAVTHATDRMRDGMHKMIEQQKATLSYFPSAFWTDLESEMAKVDWVAVAIPVYQKYMSEEDAQKAIAFYSTEAGQRSLNSSIAVSLEMNAKGFELGKEVGTRLGQKYQSEIADGMRKAQSSRPLSPQK